MSLETLPTVIAIVLTPCIVFVEAFRVLPFGAELNRLQRNSVKSITVIRSNRISDHWKGMIIPHYAGLILRSTCLLGLFLLLCCSIFTITYLTAGYLLHTDLALVVSSFFEIDTQLSALLVGSLYALVRTKLSASSRESEQDYSVSSSFLHHVALQYGAIRELAFDLDCAATIGKTAAQSQPPPVFVTGLARGGTTILLEALYSSGHFTTLTYRNMPFITAPYLWPRLSQTFYQAREKKERAHGDRLEVDFDSPEAFEEVFWLTFSKEQYVRENSLAFQGRNEELEKKYRKYVANILAAAPADKTPTRYLAKNNNNLLRIELIKGAFPEAVILVPFRNPLDHAGSLLKQHQRFCTIHQQTPFARKYMNWLGHHEFGDNIKPFEVENRYLTTTRQQALSIDFWLGYWTAVYERLYNNHAQQLVFFNYDQLCRTPESQLASLASFVEVAPEQLTAFASAILPAKNYQQSSNSSPELLTQAEKLHEKLIRVTLAYR